MELVLARSAPQPGAGGQRLGQLRVQHPCAAPPAPVPTGDKQETMRTGQGPKIVKQFF